MSLNSSHTSNNTVTMETNTLEKERYREESRWIGGRRTRRLLFPEHGARWCDTATLSQVFIDSPLIKGLDNSSQPEPAHSGTQLQNFMAPQAVRHPHLLRLSLPGEGGGGRVSAFSDAASGAG